MEKMNIKEVKEVIKEAVNNSLPPLFIWGEPGVGKSSIIKEIAEELDIPALNFKAGNKSPISLIGYGKIDENATKFYPPFELVDFKAKVEEKGKGILFLDEIAQAPLEIQRILFELILEKRIGNFYLSNAIIIGAGNPREFSKLSQFMDIPLRNRFVHILLEINFEIWKEWAYKNGIDFRIISFLNFKKGEYLLKVPDIKDKDTLAFPTPRTWEFCSHILKSNLPSPIKDKLIINTIGFEVGSEFNVFRKINIPEPIEALKNLIIPEKIDALYLLLSAIIILVTENIDDNSFIKMFQNYLSKIHEISYELWRLSLYELKIKLLSIKQEEEVRRIFINQFKKELEYIMKKEKEAVI